MKLKITKKFIVTALKKKENHRKQVPQGTEISTKWWVKAEGEIEGEPASLNFTVDNPDQLSLEVPVNFLEDGTDGQG